MKFQKKRSYKYRTYDKNVYNLHYDFGIVDHPKFQINRSVMTVDKGYCWDGATGIPDTKKNYVPAKIHDVLFQAMREGLISRDKFKDANSELQLQYLERDGWKWWGKLLNWGTTKLGYKYTKSDIIEVF